MTIEIVILAMIAAFLALRLYSVLGRRAEHGEEPMQPHFEAPQGGIGAPPLVRALSRPAQTDMATASVATLSAPTSSTRRRGMPSARVPSARKTMRAK